MTEKGCQHLRLLSRGDVSLLAWRGKFAITARVVSRILLLLGFLIAWPAPALADEIEGVWALRIGDANIFLFEIEKSETSDWRGVWTRPESYTSNGAVFAQLQGSERVAATAAMEFADFLELSFDASRPGANPQIFRIRIAGENQAELVHIGTQFQPYPLVRVPPGTRLGPFDDTMIYDRDNAVRQIDYMELDAVEEDSQGLPDELSAEDARSDSATANDADDSEDEGSSGVTADFLDDLQ